MNDAAPAPTVITATAQLARFCERLAAEPFVTIDTEFLRDRTFWPKLCLVQLAGEREAAAVDPLAPGIDLAPLFALMANPAVVKVFHAARQDLEIFWRGPPSRLRRDRSPPAPWARAPSPARHRRASRRVRRAAPHR